jgi:dTMP kinase
VRGTGGILVTFEGCEGSGKTTQARLLHDHLASAGVSAVLSREPGGTPVGERIRRILLHRETEGIDPLAELLLYEAARREHVVQVVIPALESGAVVILDRFTDATLAYQGWGRGLGRPDIRRLNRMACGPVDPDVTFLVDVDPVEVGLSRSLARLKAAGEGTSEGRFEAEDLAFHRRVRRGYRDVARREPGRIIVMDGTRPPMDVHRDVLDALRRRFPGRPW